MTEPTEDPVQIWKKQLAALENSITPIARAAETIPVEGDDIETLLVQQEVLTSLFEQACAIIIKIEGHTGHSKRRETLFPMYIEAKSGFARRIRQAQPEEGESSRPRPPLDQTMVAGNGRGDHLPRLELPKFHGSATEWLSFKARFEKRVSTLNEDANKYAFLAKCLEYEPARNTCEALENSGLPFNEAWAKLEERFYKKRVAFEGYFFNLLKIKKINKPTQKAILGLVDAVDTLLSATKQIANEGNLALNCIANGLLVCIVKERLDEQTLSKLEEKLDLQTIYKWVDFKEELEKMANQLSCKANVESAHSGHSGHFGHGKGQQRAMAVTSSKASSNKDKKEAQRCFFCTKDGHTVFSCPALVKLGVPDRWEAVKSGRHCFNCLLQGHSSQTCKSTRKCQTCNAKHHTMLHHEEPAKRAEPIHDSQTEKDAVQASTSSSK